MSDVEKENVVKLLFDYFEFQIKWNSNQCNHRKVQLIIEICLKEVRALYNTKDLRLHDGDLKDWTVFDIVQAIKTPIYVQSIPTLKTPLGESFPPLSNYGLLDSDTVYIEQFSLRTGSIDKNTYTYAQIWNMLGDKPFPQDYIEKEPDSSMVKSSLEDREICNVGKPNKSLAPGPKLGITTLFSLNFIKEDEYSDMIEEELEMKAEAKIRKEIERKEFEKKANEKIANEKIANEKVKAESDQKKPIMTLTQARLASTNAKSLVIGQEIPAIGGKKQGTATNKNLNVSDGNSVIKSGSEKFVAKANPGSANNDNSIKYNEKNNVADAKVNSKPIEAKPESNFSTYNRPVSPTPNKSKPKEEEIMKISWNEQAKHCHSHNGWTCIRGMVYDISEYGRFRHPGGQIIFTAAGKDGTKLFDRYHKYVKPEHFLKVIGQMER